MRWRRAKADKDTGSARGRRKSRCRCRFKWKEMRRVNKNSKESDTEDDATKKLRKLRVVKSKQMVRMMTQAYGRNEQRKKLHGNGVFGERRCKHKFMQ